jgi:hypothetical protein
MKTALMYVFLVAVTPLYQSLSDGANPSFFRALKIEMGENEEYEPLVERARKMKSDVSNYMQVIPVNFSSEHKAMLGNCKMLLEKDGGYLLSIPDSTS